MGFPTGNVRRSKYVRVFLRLGFAAVMAVFLVLLGTFEGVGYQVHKVQELSFVPNYYYGFAIANFTFDATYNPVLFPFYWLMGKGHISGDFSMKYLPHGYETGEHPRPIYGQKPEDRYGNYASYVATWGTLANLVILLIMTVAIELLKHRALYALLFFGMFGFAVAGLTGTVGGLVVGVFVVLYVLRTGFRFPMSGLRGHILRRIAYSFVLVIAVITIDFIVFMRMPSNPMDFLAAHPWGQTPEENALIGQQIRGLWGLNQPLATQYFTYVRNLLSWNLGAVGTPLSKDQRVTPIVQSLQEKLPYTIFILGTGAALSLLIGILWGIATVKKRGGLFDSFSYYFSTIMLCSPVWWIGSLLLLVFTEYLNWFPRPATVPIDTMVAQLPVAYTIDPVYSSHAFGMVFNVSLPNTLMVIGGYLSYAFLPICALVLSTFGVWVLLTKASLLQTIGEDYLITARAKGVSEWKVLTKHAMRNAYLPIITSAAMSFAFIIIGSALLEIVFKYPGIGLWLWDAIWNLDYAILMTVFYVLAICVIIANAIADLLYGILDPRIRAG